MVIICCWSNDVSETRLTPARKTIDARNTKQISVRLFIYYRQMWGHQLFTCYGSLVVHYRFYDEHRACWWRRPRSMQSYSDEQLHERKLFEVLLSLWCSLVYNKVQYHAASFLWLPAFGLIFKEMNRSSEQNIWPSSVKIVLRIGICVKSALKFISR